MKTNLFALFIALFGVLTASAHDFEVDGIYYNVTSSTDLTVAVTSRDWSSSSNSGKYRGDVLIPQSVTYRGKSYTVTAIGESAFYDCAELATVVIPNTVTTIGQKAFTQSSVTTVTIPASVTTIGSQLFSNCTNLTSIVVEKGNAHYDSRDNCNAIIETQTNTLIAACRNTAIPNTVTAIGDYAFCSCSGLTSLTIPASVTTIGNAAFVFCVELVSVVIPNSVTSIGAAAFNYCIHLADITIPASVTTIGESAFYNCFSLAKINIPASLTSIGLEAFSGCSDLTSIVVENGNAYYDSRNNCNAIIETKTNKLIAGCSSTVIPCTVTAIAKYAFEGHRFLAAINIPNSVTTIGKGAFWGCETLTAINIPNSIKSLDDYLFHNCYSLTTITIPASVTSISFQAFSGCSGLTSIVSQAAVAPYLGNSVFEYANKLHDIYIPAGSTASYQAKWGASFNYIEDASVTAITSINSRPTTQGIYDLHCRMLTAPQRGINIINNHKVLLK